MTSILPINPDMNIGGELTLSLDDFLVNPGISDFWPGQHRHRLLLDTGRSAIYLALLSILQRGGKKEAWLPAYCCSSVLTPFQRLGFKIRFYTMGRDLASPGELPLDLDLNNRTFLFIHYFGKRNQTIHDYLTACQSRQRFFVIEDCVQALFTRGLGCFDYAVYSLRKFLPLPDGALLSSGTPLAPFNLAPPDEGFVSRRLIGKLIRGRVDNAGFLDLFAEAEAFIDQEPQPRAMSFLSRYLTERLTLSPIAARRMANFNYLLQLLQEVPVPAQPLFHELEAGEVPLGLPLELDPDLREPLRSYLKGQGIYCPVHWPLADARQAVFPAERLLSHSLLTLPLDQSLSEDQIAYTVEKIRRFFRSRSSSVPPRL